MSIPQNLTTLLNWRLRKLKNVIKIFKHFEKVFWKKLAARNVNKSFYVKILLTR